MDVDDKLIRYVASLARLKLSEDEIKEFIPEIKEIISSFEILSEVDINETEASFQPILIKNRLREDEKEKCFTQEEALDNSEHKKDGYFKGPRAI